MSEAEPVARWQVPDSWSWVEIGNICDVVGGGTPSTSEPANFLEGDIPWITPADLSGYTHKYIESGARAITRRGLEGSGARVLPAGTVLFSSRAPIGYVAIAKGPVTTNQGFKSFVPPTGLASDYLYYYLQHAKRLAVELSSGTTFQEISGKRARQIPLAVAPQAEQPRIVEKLEELLSDLDAGTAALERARVNLKRYRAAVLKAAVEGRLTEKWRAAHPDAEPAGKLLERILADRRKKWEEAQLKKFAEKKQVPPKGWKDRYPTPAKVEIAALPTLPNGWVWATMDQLCWRVADADHKMPKGVADGIPYISTKDFGGTNGIDFERAKRISLADFESLRKKVEPKRGDFLLSRYGTVGEVRWLRDEQPIFLASYSIACLKLANVDIGAWLNVALRSNPIQKCMLSFVRGVAQPDLGLAHIRQVSVPVPPCNEQIAIADEIARSESVFEAVEAELSSNERRGLRLRQSILKRAFEGKLVPQDPKDEPASELLARIRTGRESGKGLIGQQKFI